MGGRVQVLAVEALGRQLAKVACDGHGGGQSGHMKVRGFLGGG